MSARSQSLAAAAAVALAAAVLYAGGLLSGAITLVGYESEQTSQVGAARTRWWPIRLGIPVWLAAGDALAAEYEVEAKFGAVSISVAPPLILKTPLQTATVYVEGQRSGNVQFVAGSSGWYSFWTEPSPLGGPRCRRPGLNLRDMVIGDSSCPVYDVSYAVTWRLAERGGQAGPRVFVPRPGETLATLRIGG